MLDTILQSIYDFFRMFRIADALDIIIVAFVVYKISLLVRETRAIPIIKGIFVLLFVTWLSGALQFNTISYILRNVMQFGMLALLIVFQPELRRALERVGRTSLSNFLGMESSNDQIDEMATEIAQAAAQMGRDKVGALIVLERETKVGGDVQFGPILDARVDRDLLMNIFFKNSPLHDGAVIIRDNRIYAARCILPLTQNPSLSGEFGTRHRAALGLTEASDAVVIIVSEETGKISLARNGNMTRNFTSETLMQAIKKLLSPGQEESQRLSQRIRKERFPWMTK